MLRSLMFATAALGLSLAPAFAQETEVTEGQKLTRLNFESIDTTGKGYIHMGDLEGFVESVFLGMDYDNDGKVTYTEFSSWDPGYQQVAEHEGRPEAYATATKILFALWDIDGNGNISRSEMRRATNVDFQRADLDNNAVLTPEEFKNFNVILIFRAAIRPDL